LPQKVQGGVDELQKEIWKIEKLSNGDTPSILQDLPVEKYGNSYSKVENGMFVPTEGSASPPSEHSFCFKFFSTPSAYVKTIDYIMLTEATDKIVFRSKVAARNMIEGFLTDDNPLKLVTDLPGDTSAKCIKTLETIVQQLGGSAKSDHKVTSIPQTDDALFDVLGQYFEQLFPGAPSVAEKPFFTTYKRLGRVVSTVLMRL